MNDPMGPNGLVPSLLVFGILSRFPPTSSRLPSHEERMEAMEIARLEMTNITAQVRLQQALRTKLPPATHYHVDPGDEGFVHSEPEGKWRGPFQVKQTFDKQVYVDRNGTEAQYSMDHIIPDKHALGNGLIHHIHSCLPKKASRQLPRVFLTEVLQPWYSRGKYVCFDAAKQKEILGLIEEGT